MQRRPHVPDIRVTADQILRDLRSDLRTPEERAAGDVSMGGEIEIHADGSQEQSDALGTIVSNLAVDPPDYQIQEDDLIWLVFELAYRVIDCERAPR